MAKAKLYIKNGNSWVNYNLLNAYPVGAIYASANSTSPASLFGGQLDSNYRCCTLNRATLLQLLYVATYKLNLQEAM